MKKLLKYNRLRQNVNDLVCCYFYIPKQPIFSVLQQSWLISCIFHIQFFNNFTYAIRLILFQDFQLLQQKRIRECICLSLKSTRKEIRSCAGTMAGQWKLDLFSNNIIFAAVCSRKFIKPPLSILLNLRNYRASFFQFAQNMKSQSLSQQGMK